MQYTTVFDVTREGFTAWRVPALTAIGVILAIAMLVFVRHHSSVVGGRRTHVWLFLALFIFVSSCSAIQDFASTYVPYSHMRDSLATGHYAIVEGLVTDFKPAPYDAFTDEEFTVSGHRYSYRQYSRGPGYHLTRAHGGAIREGVPVRLAIVGGSIARLEVAADVTPEVTPVPPAPKAPFGPEFERYGWFFCAAFWLVVVFVWSRRLAPRVAAGAVTAEDSTRFLRLIGAYAVGLPFLLGVIALASGISTMECPGLLSFDSVPRALTTGVSLASWVGLLAWVWIGSGAELLARVVPALFSGPPQPRQYSPALMRGAVTLILLAAVAGSAITATDPRWRDQCPSHTASR